MFVDRDDPPVFAYGHDRNRMDLAGTSQLSPYLRFGMLSARQAAVAALRRCADAGRARRGAETWLNELIWREFYMPILLSLPACAREAFGRICAHPLAQRPGRFRRLVRGRTGYPVVDAAMRQLVQTGWMHNRARMIVASFLVKDLLIDWRWGERWFMQHLIDGDPAANNGGWQWTAGWAPTPRPIFASSIPCRRARSSIPTAYISAAGCRSCARADEFIHEPWKMPSEVQRAAGCVIGGTIRCRSWITLWGASAPWQPISNQGGTSAPNRDVSHGLLLQPALSRTRSAGASGEPGPAGAGDGAAWLPQA